MPRILRTLMIQVVLFSIIADLAAVALAEDAWEAAHRAAQAKNPPGVTLTLRAPDDRTQFRQNELIPIQLEFSLTNPDYSVNRLVDMIRDFRNETFVVDPATGTGDPYSGVEEKSGVYYGRELDPSSNDAYYLNDWLRFNKPGRYRIYLKSGRVTPTTAGAPSKTAPPPVTTSDIIALEIIPADPVWEAQQIREVVNILDTRPGDFVEGPRAARILRFLRTPAAAHEIIRHFNDANMRSQRELESGIFTFPDRAWLIREMERALTAPGQAVALEFLGVLVNLKFPLTHPKPEPAWMRTRQKPTKKQDEQWRKEAARQRAARQALLLGYWQRTADALPLKTGSARTTTLASLLGTVWWGTGWGWLNGASFSRLPAVAARFPGLIKQMVASFDDLPSERQLELLSMRWPQVREVMGSEAMLPILRRVLSSSVPQAASYSGSGAYWDRMHLIGLALRGIYELAPDEGRRLILAEIQNPRHRTTIAYLSILPEQTLPELDEVLARNIEDKSGTSDDQTTNWSLVERYASPAIAERVKTVMGGRFAVWGCVAEGAPFAYLLRADPDFGAQAVEKALSGPKENMGCYRYLLSSLAEQPKTQQTRTHYGLPVNVTESPFKRHMTPELEKVAIAHLDDANAEIVVDAVQALGAHGSAAAEAPLWQRLRQLRDKSHEAVDIQPVPGLPSIEGVLVAALAQGTNWLSDTANLEQLGDLCQTPASRQQVESRLKLWSDKIQLQYEPHFDEWWVAQYHGYSVAALKNKLAQFPPGTAFSWRLNVYRAPGQPEPVSPVFRELQTFLQMHGMTLLPTQK